MLIVTTKTSPQGVTIEYIEPASGVQATEREVAQYKREMELDWQRRNRAVRRVAPMTLAGFGGSARVHR